MKKVKNEKDIRSFFKTISTCGSASDVTVDDIESIQQDSLATEPLFCSSQIVTRPEKTRVVWLNSPPAKLIENKSVATPLVRRPLRSFSLSAMDASPAIQIPNKKKSKTCHWTSSEKTEKFKELWENVQDNESNYSEISRKDNVVDQSRACTADLNRFMQEKENNPNIISTQDTFVQNECFSDLDDELFLSMDVEAVIQKAEESHGGTAKRPYYRICISSVHDAGYNLQLNTMVKEIKGVLQDKNKIEMCISFHDDWYDLFLHPGDFIHITGFLDINQSHHIIGNDSPNLVITHPDLLLSATHVADSFDCARKACLQNRISARNESSPAMVHGKMLHELFQMSLKSKDFTSDKIRENIDQIVKSSIVDLYSIGESESDSKSFLLGQVQALSSWADSYFRPNPQKSSVLETSVGILGPSFGSIKKVLEIEERIWSPKYGIKGYVDATAVLQVEQEKSKSSLVVPIEFKTGKYSSFAHEAQTALYTLMISDRYGVECSTGILYYLSGNKMKMISRASHHIRALILGRNLVAHYLISANELPPLLSRRKFTCERCYALDSCLFYHKVVEGGNKETITPSGLTIEFEEKTGYLNDNHIQFFKKWDRLITLEENSSESFKKEIWAMDSKNRQALGRCFSQMKICKTIKGGSLFANELTFECADKHSKLCDSSLKETDPIVISSEQGDVALAIGYVKKITETDITVTVDKSFVGLPRREADFDEYTNQDFISRLETPEENSKEILYRIDKDELTAGSSTARNNLIGLFTDPNCIKLRKLIVDLDKPFFSSVTYRPIDSRINEDQANAISKVLAARDYVIILGMPGTGKTFTISQLIKELTKKKKSVLLTSYTHSAVDNVLLKLIEEQVDFVRIGNLQRIHPNILPFTPEHQENISTVAAMESFYDSKYVVATTCLALNHVIFSKKRFDYCIVDEASQLTLPYCIGPLKYANTFVLVGDHFQLTPLVRNEEAIKGGMTESLFKRLSDGRPESVVDLRYQYRMNSEIMHLSNSLIYDNRLICGSAQVAQYALYLPKMCEYFYTKGIISSTIMARILNPRTRVLFLNTDSISTSLDSRVGDLVQNTVECQIIKQITTNLLLCGALGNQIGILSLYHSQLELLKRECEIDQLEFFTVDKCQGRDKDCIIVSFVRSNVTKSVGNLMQDWRRINVLLTRAKKKLIMIGSVSTLKTVPLLDQLFELLGECVANLQ